MVNFQPVDLSESPNVNVSNNAPLTEFLKLVGGLIAIVLTFILVTSLVVDAAILLVPEKLEAQLADTLQPLIAAEYDVIPTDDNTQQLFNGLTHPLPNPNAYTLHLVNDDDTINALTTPGGHIYLFTGLAKKLHTNEQLAFVLGHELGHAKHRHVIRSMSKGVIIGAALGILFPNSNAVGDGIGQLLNVGMLNYSRDQEYEADTTSVDLLQQQGLDPAKGITFFNVLSSIRNDGSTSILSTHPTDKERIERLEQYLQSQS